MARHTKTVILIKFILARVN